MSSATSVNQFEAMYLSNQLMPHTELVSDNKTGSSHDSGFSHAQQLLPGKTLPQLLGCIGKNPRLIDELASKKSRKERVHLLINHKLIASENDLPSGKAMQQEMPYLFAPSGKREEMLEGAKAAWAVIVYGGSFEN